VGEALTATYFIASVLLPPTSLLLLAWLGVAAAWRRRRWGLGLAAASLLALLALSMPRVGYLLARTLEPQQPIDLDLAGTAQAIVILAGGITRSAPEWDGATLSIDSLQRTRYGAALARRLDLPILVSGGSPSGGPAEARLMAATLEREFALLPRWVEDGSDNTLDNARHSAALLRAAGIHRIVLVTSATHMRRALRAFERAGLQVEPAPTAFLGQAPPRLAQWVPSVEGLRVTDRALREWLGIVFYRLRELGA
jgi:uncharacterized SAM-binding protein YcdF (DUF218 family)